MNDGTVEDGDKIPEEGLGMPDDPAAPEAVEDIRVRLIKLATQMTTFAGTLHDSCPPWQPTNGDIVAMMALFTARMEDVSYHAIRFGCGHDEFQEYVTEFSGVGAAPEEPDKSWENLDVAAIVRALE